MVHLVLLCCAILVDGNKPADASATDRAAYETAAAKAGNNAAAHVKLALWCETHGLSAERIKHLSAASTLDPSNVLARGLLGLVAFQGKWTKPDQVEKEIHDDPKLQAVFREYLDRRVRTPQKNADAQLRLAAWCLESGLNDEAMAHYRLVTRLDPSRDIAWLRLGYKKQHDRWSKPEVLAAQKLEADRQKRADAFWKTRLEKLRDGIESSVETRRLKAERELYQVTDPRAVAMISRTLGNSSEQLQSIAIELLSQIEGPSPSFQILMIAMRTPSTVLRERATRVLARRDPRDVIGWLVALVHKPFKYEVKPGDGPGSQGVLFVEGERFDIRRLYYFPLSDMLPTGLSVIAFETGMDMNPFASPPGPGANSPPAPRSAGMSMRIAEQLYANAIMAEAIRRSEAVKQTLEDDVQTVQNLNAQIDQTNARVMPMLEALTGQNFGVDPKTWQTWWANELGLVVDDRYEEPKPVVSDFVGLPDVVPVHSACFAGGTLVQTIGGPRRIESISLGDRVLAQNTASGALSFQPVLATHINGPAKTLQISVGGETIVATGIHRFWVAGKGWTMARDLKAGDRLRMISGIATIESISPGPTQKVYNLSVADDRDFLVGSAGLLVHDFSFVLPVSEPFDTLKTATPRASR
jgi:hypothetical protein